jgi:demethoxyubiquinone hydroxylase (CLK1/Coq7/Cat5 family)
MDWTAAGVVVTGTALVLGAAAAWLDQRFSLKIRENNDELLERINGTYVKREVYERDRESAKNIDRLRRFEREH